MTDPAEKKEEIKKHVRALLLSSPAPLTVKELERDFYNFLGSRLAYRELGYTTAEEFLRDIEDAVTISYRNGFMTLTAKADDSTKHIQKLVSKQRVTNKKKYAIYRNRGGGHPRLFQGRSDCPPRFAAAASRCVVPAYVRKQMKDLFRSFPDGVAVSHLDSAFSRIFGTGINYRNYGFQSQYQFLQSLQDIVKVEEVFKGEWRVLPVSYVKESSAKPPVINETNNMENVQKELEPATNRQDNLQSQSQKRPSKGRGRRRENSEGSDGVVGRDAKSVDSTNSHGDENLEREIQQVLENKSEGVWASRFPFEFAELHGKALNYREHGFLSVIDFLSSLPDIVRTVRPSPHGDWRLYDARLPDFSTEENLKTRSRLCSGKAVESETKEAIQIILNSRPSGIPVKDFPDIFKGYTGRKLPVRDLGFESPEDLFLSLADTILQFAYNGNEMLMYSMDTEIVETEQDAGFSLPAEVLGIDNIPSDVVGPGCHFVPVMLPNPEQYVELYVTNVVNPGLFWVMLRHKTKSLALETLMDQLDEVYVKEQEADGYRMPECLMVPGQICATLFPEDNNWHRGVITGCNNAGFMEIYYVDYGNTNFVQKSTIRFLKSEFITLPAQAVQARLANTHPVSGMNGKWKNKSRSRLLELTCHRPLVAYVCDVKSQKMSLCLTDTNQPDVDIHINDVMVSEGLAMFIPDVEVTTPPETQKHCAEPDYGHVFGWNATNTPRLPKVAQSEGRSQTEPEGSDAQNHCYVKWIQLDESCVLHLINLNRQAYVVSAEISSLFWEEDVLTSMLKRKRVELGKRVVSSDELPDLFKELVKYKVKSVRSDGDCKQQFLSLYKLESLPKILELFEDESETLVTAVHELITKYDLDSPYWKSGGGVEETLQSGGGVEETLQSGGGVEETLQSGGGVDETLQSGGGVEETLQKGGGVEETFQSGGGVEETLQGEGGVEETLQGEGGVEETLQGEGGVEERPGETVQDEDSAEQTLSIEEKQMALKALQFKRKRILQSMMNSAGALEDDVVNQLNNCEVEIMVLKQELQEHAKSVDRVAEAPSHSQAVNKVEQANKDNTDQTNENQRVIENIIASATKPIAAANIMTKPVTSTATSKPITSSSQLNYQFNMNESFMSQSATGSLPGMLGAQNMAFLQQQQRMMNPMMTQTGLPTSGMGDMTNSVMAGNIGFGMGLNPNFQPGLLPQLNPLLFQFPSAHSANIPGLDNMQHMAPMQNIGRGQVLNPSSIGILPGLLPLVQNLSAGRGRGSGSNNQ